MTIFTIGFTKKRARAFFETLKAAGVKRVLDVRLNNSSQLAGFTKKDDLEYFLGAVAGIAYSHLPELAPTKEILDDFKKNSGDWEAYETRFRELLESRKASETVPKELFAGGCLLCSEDKPDRCHRRLAAEYLKDKWGDVEILHL